MITHGLVEVHRSDGQDGEKLVDYLNPGQYFSELDFQDEAACDLSFSVSPYEPVETLWLNSHAFRELLAGSQHAERALMPAPARTGLRFCSEDEKVEGE